MQLPNRSPIWVVEILFNKGNHGVEGTNDVYFGSAPISEIKNFPWPDRYFHLLDPQSIGGLDQSLDLINGVSSISDVSFSIIDYNHVFSDIIQATDAINQGLRMQLCEVYQIEAGGDWLTDSAKFRTMKMTDATQRADGTRWDCTAHDVQKDMQRDVFVGEISTLAAAVTTAGELSFQLVDSSKFLLVQQPVFGLVGLAKIDDEIVMWNAKSASHVMTVAASGRGMFGTVATTHDIGAEVSEVILLKGNPMACALGVLTSTGAGTNGAYDIYPAHWGLGLDAVADTHVTEWETVGASIAGLAAGDYTSGMQYEFKIGKKWSGKTWLESRVLKVLGAFAKVHGDGRYGVQAYSDLANVAKENAERWITDDDIVKIGDAKLFGKLINDILVKYDQFPPLSGKYIRSARFRDLESQDKYRKTGLLEIKADGVVPNTQNVTQLYQRIHLVGAQMSRPGMERPVTLLPQHSDIRVGAILRLSVGIRDPYTGQDYDRAVQVTKVRINKRTSEPTCDVISQHEKATFWQGGTGAVATLIISPDNLQIEAGATFQLVARTFDQSGNQLPNGTIGWVATGNVTVDGSGVVTGTVNGSGTVYAVAADVVSNVLNITVQAASTNPVTDVAVAPSSASLQIGNTQQFSAQALDLNGDAVAGQTFVWASSDTNIATIDPNGLATAVADGSANITATVGSVVSPVAWLTVKPIIPPEFQPKYIVDAVYLGSLLPAGTELLWDGTTDLTLAAGYYWVNGDLTIAFGVTLTITGTVWISGTGVFTNLGTINGKGRGRAGANGIASNSAWAPQGYVWYVNWLGAHPQAGGGTPGGFVGLAGDGGSHRANGFPLGSPGKGGVPLFNAVPLINVIGTAEDVSGSWTAVAGIPDVLDGDGGGAGGAIDYPTPGISTGGNGGDAGAGLGLFFRGIFNTTGLIDLRGNDGMPGNGVSNASHFGGWSGGGGASGGTLVALAERDVNGLPVLAVDMNRVLTDGGAPGASNGWYVGAAATAGGPGAKIAQVIG